MSPMLNDEQTQTIFSALEDMAKSVVWQQSTFLRSIGKQVLHLQTQFQELITRSTQVTPNRYTKMTSAMSAALSDKKVSIYIALYSTKGTDFNTWLHILNNLPANLVSRPIYATEKEARAAVRAKPNPDNEAYLCVEIGESHIVTLPQDKTPLDKLKQPLIVIKGQPIAAQYTGVFVHKGVRYKFIEGHLGPGAS